MGPTSREPGWGRGLLLAVAAGALLAVPQAVGADVVTERAVEQSRASVLDYWTKERMATARPASQILRGVTERLAPAPGERGRPSSVPAAGPARNAGLLEDLLGGGNARRRDAQPIANPRRAPFRTHGKVFLTLDGINFVCSATVVNAETRRLVVTAGHCVYDGGFATNWMFIPAKDGADEPFGRWTAGRLAATRQWRQSTANADFSDDDVRFDVGMATMRKRNGKRIQKVVGARGIAFSKGRDRNFGIFGYPAEPPFDGATLHRCLSPGQGSDGQLTRPRPTRVDCDMTGGASGGGWVIGRGRINSVTSYGYEGVCVLLICTEDPDGDKLYGPYFGNTIRALYRSQAQR